MLPIIIGIGAALILAGCSKDEETEPVEREPLVPQRKLPPAPRPESSEASARAHPQASAWSQAGRRTRSNPFATAACDSTQPVPSRLVLQDPRQEFCELHSLLTGSTCEIQDNRVRFSEIRRDGGLFSWAARLGHDSDFSQAQNNADFFRKLSSLEGLPLYLSDGQACQFDNVVDLQNLVTVYSLLYTTLQSDRWSQPFQEGRMGCILYSAPITFSGTHQHEINGEQVEHNQASTHSLLLTPAHLTAGYRSENPGFPNLDPETQVSDCIEVR